METKETFIEQEDLRIPLCNGKESPTCSPHFPTVAAELYYPLNAALPRWNLCPGGIFWGDRVNGLQRDKGEAMRFFCNKTWSYQSLIFPPSSQVISLACSVRIIYFGMEVLDDRRHTTIKAWTENGVTRCCVFISTLLFIVCLRCFLTFATNR